MWIKLSAHEPCSRFIAKELTVWRGESWIQLSLLKNKQIQKLQVIISSNYSYYCFGNFTPSNFLYSILSLAFWLLRKVCMECGVMGCSREHSQVPASCQATLARGLQRVCINSQMCFRACSEQCRTKWKKSSLGCQRTVRLNPLGGCDWTKGG